jgi:hypothetical protein
MVAAQVSEIYALGNFQIVANVDGQSVDITNFRGYPIRIGSYSKADPFGDRQLTLEIPQVTSLDTLGNGDLWWCVPWADIDISWIPDRALFDSDVAQTNAIKNWRNKWRWVGQITTFDRSSTDKATSFSIDCRGALYQLDNYVSRPSNPTRPIPYETLIEKSFSRAIRPGLSTQECSVTYPPGWDVTVPVYPASQSYLAPLYKNPGDKYSGLSTRATGNWSPVLTGFIQALLSVMYTGAGGQWTLMNHGRQPQLFVRDKPNSPNDQTLWIDVTSPGLTHSLSQDYTQTANVVYGQGSDYAGNQFSNAQSVIGSLSETVDHEPFIALPEVHPVSNKSSTYDPSVERKEVHQTFQDGLSAAEAADVARQYVMRFNEPGWVGTLTLKVDPIQSGELYPRLLINPGMTIVLSNFNGAGKEIMFHIAEVTVTPEEGTVTLTVDTKFRDLLTIQEVRERGRDALEIRRFLKNNKLKLPFDDYLKPWDYTKGSGCIPESSKALHERMGSRPKFPWTDWTTQYPPKDYPNYYIKIPPKNSSFPDDNWGGPRQLTQGGGWVVQSSPILLAAAGTVDLTQIAAYDKNGNVMPVSFHASIYNLNHTSSAMPMVPSGVTTPYSATTATATFVNGQPGPTTTPRDYTVNSTAGFPSEGMLYLLSGTWWCPVRYTGKTSTQFLDVVYNGLENPFANTTMPNGVTAKFDRSQLHYPYFPGAFEAIDEDGTQKSENNSFAPDGLVVGWGNYYQKAGYYPGLMTAGDPPTGLLVDEENWTFDTKAYLDLENVQKNNNDSTAGRYYIMIYCDDHPTDEPVYFLGRCFKAEITGDSSNG